MAVRFVDLQLIYGVAGAREKFEQLVALLVRSAHPGASAVRVHKGDGGVDAFVGDWAVDGQVHVFQVKFFPEGLGTSQRRQVKTSFESAQQNQAFRLTNWTLCIPVDLSSEERTWFSEWSETTRLSMGVETTVWGEVELLGLLLNPANRGVKEAYFKEEYLTQIREMHQMLRALVDEFNSRSAPATNDLAVPQALAYLDSNLAIAAAISGAASSGQVPQVALDTASWAVVGPTILSALPQTTGDFVRMFQSLQHANRLIGQVHDTLRNPRYPSGFWNRDGISYSEIENAPRQFTQQALMTLRLFIDTNLLPEMRRLRALVQTAGDQR